MALNLLLYIAATAKTLASGFGFARPGRRESWTDSASLGFSLSLSPGGGVRSLHLELKNYQMAPGCSTESLS